VLTTHYLEEAELLCGRIGMLKAGRLVALDSTRNLLHTFPGLRLKLRLDREELPPQLAPRLLERAGDRFTLELRDYAELEQVLVGLREAGETILEFELQPPDLEEVFVRIMDRSS
jgi:ABC-2 type transport system ATP-binding protein